MRPNLIKRFFATLLTFVIVFTGGIGITAKQALAYNAGVEAFVNSLYADCLGRTADPTGFNDWCTKLTNGTITGKEAAYGFFFSPEFMSASQRLSNRELINVYYKVFLNRGADSAGAAYWESKISPSYINNDVAIALLFVGFADSTEFANKCASYGINAGEPIGISIDSIVSAAQGSAPSSSASSNTAYPTNISGIQWYYDNGFREYNLYVGLGRYQRCLYREYDCSAEYNAINNYRATLGLPAYNAVNDGPYHQYALIRAIEVAYNFTHSSPCYYTCDIYPNVPINPERNPDLPDLVNVHENICSGSMGNCLPFDIYVNSPMHEKEYRYTLWWNGSEYIDLGEARQNHNMAAASVDVYWILADGTITQSSPMANDTTSVFRLEQTTVNAFYDSRTTGRSEVEIFWS